MNAIFHTETSLAATNADIFRWLNFAGNRPSWQTKNALCKYLVNDLTGQVVRRVAFSNDKMPVGEAIELLTFLK